MFNKIQNNKFSLEILSPTSLITTVNIDGNDYFTLSQNSRYNMRLGNYRSVACDAYVYMDSNLIGLWRINPYSTIIIKNQVTKGDFVFQDNNNYENNNIIKNTDDGLIKVIFKPAKIIYREIYSKVNNGFTREDGSLITDEYNSIIKPIRRRQEMTDEKARQFYNFGNNYTRQLVDIDTANITIIYARLIVDNYEQYKTKLSGQTFGSYSVPGNIEDESLAVAKWRTKELCNYFCI